MVLRKKPAFPTHPDWGILGESSPKINLEHLSGAPPDKPD